MLKHLQSNTRSTKNELNAHHSTSGLKLGHSFTFLKHKYQTKCMKFPLQLLYSTSNLATTPAALLCSLCLLQLQEAVEETVEETQHKLANCKFNWLTSWAESDCKWMKRANYGLWNRTVSAWRRRGSDDARPYKNNKINRRLNSSCLVYEPWFSYISYVFHGTIKARGNPQCLQLLLNITRFGPRGRVLGLRRLLEKGERGRGGR